MRPASIRWFDRLFLTALALRVSPNALNALVDWQALVPNPDEPFYRLTWFAVRTILDCTFWFFISRRASNLAKWLWIISLAFGVIALPFLSIMVGGDIIGAFLQVGAVRGTVEVIWLLSSIGAAIMLLRTDAANWFASRGKLVDVSTFS